MQGRSAVFAAAFDHSAGLEHGQLVKKTDFVAGCLRVKALRSPAT